MIAGLAYTSDGDYALAILVLDLCARGVRDYGFLICNSINYLSILSLVGNNGPLMLSLFLLMMLLILPWLANRFSESNGSRRLDFIGVTLHTLCDVYHC